MTPAMTIAKLREDLRWEIEGYDRAWLIKVAKFSTKLLDVAEAAKHAIESINMGTGLMTVEHWNKISQALAALEANDDK